MAKKIKALFANIEPKTLLFALLGSAIIAFGTYNINANSDIPEGGIIGLCLIIEHFTSISPAISNLVINGFCYLLAWRLLGTKFIVNAGFATLGFSVFYALFEAFPPVIPVLSAYPLLAALIGALFIEVGTGITVRFGSAPSGEHAIAVALAKKGNLDFGWINFLRDFVVIVLAYSYADPYSVIYALLIMTVTTPLMDYIAKAPKGVNFVKRTNRTKKHWIPIVITGLVLVLIIGIATAFILDTSETDDRAVSSFKAEYIEDATTVDLAEGITAYKPKGEIKAGLVFYPGARIEYTAYEPLLLACAENGILCIAVEMPYNLAFMDINKALEVMELYPDIESWYIAGHSLGGSIAANCASTHPDAFDGVILLASYSTSDISNMSVCSIYGTNDGVINLYNYEANLDNISGEHFGGTQKILKGNHSYFGMYGLQDGDNDAGISNAEQILETAEIISQFILE